MKAKVSRRTFLTSAMGAAIASTPDRAAATRQQILSAIATERRLMYAYHFPFPGIGYLRTRSGGGFEWEPINWKFES